MDTMTVTGQELMLLAAKLGSSTFYGVRDPFRGMTPEDIQEVRIPLQQSLEAKGFATMGFDDSFIVKPTVAELVTTCAMCDNYLCAGAVRNSVESAPYRCYRKDDLLVELRQDGDTMELRRTTAAQMSETLSALLGRDDPCDPPDEHIVLSYGDLFAAQQEPDDGNALSLLVQAGCSETAAQILLDGLRQRADFSTVMVTDLQKQTSNGLFCICSSSGRLCIRQVEGAQGWQVDGASRADVTAALSALAGTLLQAKGG